MAVTRRTDLTDALLASPGFDKGAVAHFTRTGPRDPGTYWSPARKKRYLKRRLTERRDAILQGPSRRQVS